MSSYDVQDDRQLKAQLEYIHSIGVSHRSGWLLLGSQQALSFIRRGLAKEGPSVTFLHHSFSLLALL